MAPTTEPDPRDDQVSPDEPDEVPAGVGTTQSDEGSTFEPEEDPDAYE